MKNVVVRSLSGLVYVALIVLAIYFGEWAFFALTSLFTAVGIYEYHIMAHTPYGDGNHYSSAMTIDVIFGLMIALSATFAPLSIVFVLVLALYMLVRATMALTDHGERAYREVAKSVLGLLYVAMPMYLLNCTYTSMGEDSHWLVLIMFVLIWLNDTGAFCFGSTLGKHRLCERLSPKKSWEGFWGGFGCCVAFGVLCYYQFNYVGFSLVAWIVYGALVSIFATWGDLFESMLKRTVKVKDSGNLIPGHGGILDRIDSLLFVAPMTYLMIVLYTITPL